MVNYYDEIQPIESLASAHRAHQPAGNEEKAREFGVRARGREAVVLSYGERRRGERRQHAAGEWTGDRRRGERRSQVPMFRNGEGGWGEAEIVVLAVRKNTGGTALSPGAHVCVTAADDLAAGSAKSVGYEDAATAMNKDSASDCDYVVHLTAQKPK